MFEGGSRVRASLPRTLRVGLVTLVVVVAVAVLAGWIFDVDALKRGLPGLVTMKFNTALCLLAGGLAVALISSRHRAGRMAAGAAATIMFAIAALTLVEYATHAKFGLDEWVVRDLDPASRPISGRMSVATGMAIAFGAVGLMLLAWGRSRRAVTTAHLFAAIPAAIGLLALAGYAYGVESLYTFGPAASVALNTAVLLLALALALLTTRPDEGWRRPFLGRAIALRALREIALVSAATPLLLGYLIVCGARRGLYKPEFSPAPFAVVAAAALVWVAFRSAAVLSAAEGAMIEARRDARASEERLDQALSSGRGIGTWDWDVVADRVVSDARFARLYGVDPEAARHGAPIAQFLKTVHPGDLPRLRARIDAALTTGGPFAEEYRLLRPDGALCWVVGEGRCELDADGAAVRFPGFSFEITDRKAAETRQAAFVAIEDRLRDLTDAEAIAFAASEVLARALDVDRAGYGVVDLMSETIVIARDYNAPGVRSIAGVLNFRDYGSYIDDLRRGETVVVADARSDVRTRDDAAALEAIAARSFVNMPVVEHGGFVALFFASHGDIRAWSPNDIALMREVAGRVRVATERVRAQAAQRKSEEQFRVFAQAMPNHVWAARPDGYIEWFNDRVYAYCGEPAGGLDGVDPWTRRLHPDDREAAMETWRRALATGEIYETQFRVRRHDGVYRWFLVRGEPVRAPDGEIVRWVGANTDIEDGKRQAAELARLNAGLEAEVETRTHALLSAEAQLRQAQKMEAVGQLTGGIAHDFNNLLTGVTGSLELIRARLAQGRLDAVDRYILSAEGAAKRAAALTQRLLAFSRRQTLDPKPVNVNRLIAGMEDILRRAVGPSVAIEVVGAGGLWSTLIDASQLDNALLNLCINGRDAMPDGGVLTIETANKWLDDRAASERDLSPGQYVTLSVTDTGTGMTTEVIERAFDPFFTTKPLGAGTGLGLSMIYGFVRQSGGQVRIYSELGQGTTMCLYLPRYVGDDEDAAAAVGATKLDGAVAGETVLVVDDEPTVRMLVSEILEDAGYTAIEAGDGAAGLKVLQTDTRIDLLITDVGLPGGMNGRQVADAARVLRPDLKVLFITGYAENAVIGAGHLDAGMKVVTKPFTMDALASKIREMIQT